MSSSLAFVLKIFIDRGPNQVGLTATGKIVANSVRPLLISQLNSESLQRHQAAASRFKLII